MRSNPRIRTGWWTGLGLLALLLGLAAPPARAAQDGKDKGDKEQLQGTWVVVTAIVSGENLPDEVAKTIKLIIQGDKATIEILGEKKNGSFVLDTAKKPKTVDINADGMALKGIYDYDGKHLKMCVCDSERPKEFKSEANSQHILVTFKRAEEAKKEKSQRLVPPQGTSFTSLPLVQDGKDKKSDKELLQGSWSLESGEKGGEKPPDEFLKSVNLRFAGDKLIFVFAGVEKESTYKIDASKTPKTLDFTVDNKAIEAIYEIKGDTLRICGAGAGEGRPAEFKSPAGSQAVLLIMKRVAAKKDKDDPREEARVRHFFTSFLQKEAKDQDHERFQGTWQAQSAELAGEKIPDEFVKAVRLVIKGDKVSASFMGEAKDGSFKIDSSKKPKTLDLTVDNKTIEAIYELEGDTLKVCASEGGRPKEFKSEAGSQSILLVLKRVPAKDQKDQKDKGNQEARLRRAALVTLAQGAPAQGAPAQAKDDKTKEPAKDKATEKAKDTPKQKGDLGALQGVWRVVSMEAGGMQIPVEMLGERGSFRMVISGDKVAMVSGDPDGEEGSIKLDETAKPKQIDFVLKRERSSAVGIYKLEGNTLTICVTPSNQGQGAARPSEFKTDMNGKEVFLMVLERSSGEKPAAKLAQASEPTKEQVAAAMVRTANNLKQIGIAIHNYHDAHKYMPAPAIYSKDGKPLLSWRVAILPFIEQDHLFREFKLDEPWDSAHNKKLLARMPAVYAPALGKVEPGMTFFQVFNGEGALFEGAKKIRITNIKDGTANTVMVVEAASAVPWTKPDDLPFDPKSKDLPKLGGTFSAGFHVLMCDASVHFVHKNFDAAIFRAMITRANGDLVDLERLNLPDKKKKVPETRKSEK
jgi:uncharacterized protein (TIGR03067 family)